MAAINPFPIKELRQLKPKPIAGLDINKGTLEVNAGKNFPWNASKLNILTNVSEEHNNGNNIILVVDKLNNLRVIYNSMNPIRAYSEIIFDVSGVDKLQNHHIAITWSLENKELILYFDGKPMIKKEIEIKEK